MAPNVTSDKRARKSHGRMVQPVLPALPLIPGQKSKSTKSVTPSPEGQEISTSSPKNTSANPENTLPNESTFAADLPQVDTPRTGSPPGKEPSVPASPQPQTPQVSTPAPLELAAEPSQGSASSDKEVVSPEFNPDASGSLAAEANLGVDEPTNNEAPGTGREDIQEAGDNETGRYSQSSGATSAVAEQDYHQEVASQPELSMTTANTVLFNVVNGLSRFTPTENGSAAGLQKDQRDRDRQYAQTSGSAVAPESPINGFHQPMITPSGSGSGSRPASSVSAPRQFNNLPSIQEYLLHVATTKDGADWAIQVNPPNAQPFIIYAHGIMLCRSMRVRRLMSRPHTTGYPSNPINLYPARYVIIHAFEAALRYLYSDTVLTKDFFVQPPPGTDFQATRIHNLDYIFSYWVSGIELGLEPVSVSAEKILSGYLDWDIIEITYKYATELATSPMSSLGKNMVGSDYLVASASIIRMILQFLAAHIDASNFKLDISSSSNILTPRLPQLDDGRPKTNPALASMVFGSMPSSADLSPSSPLSETIPAASTFKDTVASHILLNVDFESLNLFNNLIHARNLPGSTRLMADVVNERETRRHKILHSRSVSNKDRMANSALWEPVGLKESLRDTVLTRERVGFILSSK